MHTSTPPPQALPLPSNERRAKITVVLLCIAIAFHVLGFLCYLYSTTGLSLLPSLADYYAAYWPVNELVLYLLLTIYFILWFRRAYTNIRRQGKQTRYAPGWAAGSWFVPVINLWYPYQIMREIWEYTFRASRSAAIVGWWWALWLGGRFGWTFSMRSSMDGFLNHGQQAWLDLFVNLLQTGAALLLLLIVRRIAAAEHAKTN